MRIVQDLLAEERRKKQSSVKDSSCEAILVGASRRKYRMTEPSWCPPAYWHSDSLTELKLSETVNRVGWPSWHCK